VIVPKLGSLIEPRTPTLPRKTGDFDMPDTYGDRVALSLVMEDGFTVWACQLTKPTPMTEHRRFESLVSMAVLGEAD
jgi:hypothetical protein